MSRSVRKTPIYNVYCSRSHKQIKQYTNRKYRRVDNINLKCSDVDNYVITHKYCAVDTRETPKYYYSPKSYEHDLLFAWYYKKNRKNDYKFVNRKLHQLLGK